MFKAGINITHHYVRSMKYVSRPQKIHSPARIYKKDPRWGEFIFRHARPTRQVIFSVSIDINYSEQKFAKETFKHLPSDFTLICVVFR